MSQAVSTTPRADVVGPYSPWPRRRETNWKRPAISVAGIAAAAAFVHCVVPMLA